MDVNLNGDDGRIICKELKDNAETNAIPIIICSGSPNLLTDFKTFKADDYLEKPFEISTVISKIKNLLHLS